MSTIFYVKHLLFATWRARMSRYEKQRCTI